MHLGHRNNKLKALGTKGNPILSLGNKDIYSNFNNTIRLNNGSGMSNNNVMPTGHAPFHPIGLKR